MIANNFKQNELNEFAESHTLRHDTSCCDDHAPVNGTYTRTAKRYNRDVSKNCFDDDACEEDTMLGDDVTMKPIYSRRSSRGSLHKMARQRSNDRVLDASSASSSAQPPQKSEGTCTECGSRTPASKKRRPASQRDLRHKRTKSGVNRAGVAAVATVSPEQEVAIYGFPQQLTQSAPDLTNMPPTPASWAISPDEVYAASPYNFPPTSVQSTPYRVTYTQEPEVKRATIGAPRSARRMLNYTFDQYENV